MVDYIDIQENYIVAGDYDSRKRYIRKGVGASLAVCSGVTWEVSNWPTDIAAHPACGWRWSLGPRGSASFRQASQAVPAPSPLQVTTCKI